MKVYQYKLDVFEGPLDLLLHLIEKHKIDIYDIPIVDITAQYMAQLEDWNRFDIQYGSEFLVMAATLLQIKSRMLLPRAATAEGDEDDPRDELVRQLVEFKQIKTLTELLISKAEASGSLFSRPEERSELGIQSIYSFDVGQLYTLFAKSLARLTAESAPDLPLVRVEKEVWSLEEKLAELSARASAGEIIQMKAMLAAIRSRDELITTFLAILELLKFQVLTILPEERPAAGCAEAEEIRLRGCHNET